MTSFATAYKEGLQATEYLATVREMQKTIVSELNSELASLLPGVTFAWKSTRRERVVKTLSELPSLLEQPFDPYQALVAKNDSTEVELAEMRVDDDAEPWTLIVKSRSNTFVCTDVDELRAAIEAVLRLPIVASSLRLLAAPSNAPG